jgi:hypothetical protein
VRRRHVTTGVTMLVLVAILVVAVVLGARALFAPLPKGSSSSATGCTSTVVQKGQRVSSDQVVVSVFNASSRVGLADRTMLALTKRGFTKGDVGNAPLGSGVKVAQVWTTRANDVAAQLVARQLGKKIRVRRVATDLGPGVDVVLGSRFKALVRAQRTLVAPRTTSACRASSSVSPSASPGG